MGANALTGIAGLDTDARVFTPDDVMQGRLPQGRVIVYDDDHYYMGSVIAELLQNKGCKVTLVTPEDVISNWGSYTYDRWRAQSKLMDLDVELVVSKSLQSFGKASALLECTYTGRMTELQADALVTVTTRAPNDQIYYELEALHPNFSQVTKIGDCDAPAIIAANVYAGHKYARMLEEDPVALPKQDKPLYEN